MKEERDEAVLKMSNAQEQADMNAESIRNLQAVLEQFQKGIRILPKAARGHAMTKLPRS